MIPAMARHPASQFAIFLLMALVLRLSTFGDPNIHGDEVFYQTVGIAMHDGALPYVDVWDRKPFGLFALYYLIAGISAAPFAYQLAATLFAAGTAAGIAAMARRWTGVQGAVLAGATYLLCLSPLQGYGGQSPVFYNLFITTAALMTLRAAPALEQGRHPASVMFAMLLAGIGITIKTSALFEAVFLGLFCLTLVIRSAGITRRTARIALTWAAIGAAPTLLVAGFYWADGHWTEFWHAMVTSNLAKPSDVYTSRLRFLALLIQLAPILALAAFGMLEQERASRRFVLLWLGAALAGLAAVPNFYPHYALPLLVPLCVASAAFLERKWIGPAAVAIVAAISAWIFPPFQPGHAARSRQAMAALEQVIRDHDGGRGLLLYSAPSQLYHRTGHRFPTPLVFPTHLSHLIEKDVSHLSTLAETRRLLALRPGAVAMAVPIPNTPVNEETHRLVLAYVGANCRLVGVLPAHEWRKSMMIAVWGDCRR